MSATPDTSEVRRLGDFHALAALSERRIAAVEDATQPRSEDPDDAPSVDLRLPEVPPDPGGVGLLDALATRRTKRQAPDEPLSLECVAWLLHHAAAAAPEGRRPYPSAGAGYPVRLHLVALRCIDLASGSYRYEGSVGGLRATALSDPTDAVADAFGRDWVRHARAVLVMSASPEAMTEQHALRGYRYALLEAGHLAQNLLLLAASVGLPACPLGGFADEALAGIVADDAAGLPLYAIAL